MDAGGWIVLAGAIAALVAAFALRTRAPSLLVGAILAAAGAAMGWGGTLIQPDPSVGEVVVAVALLAVLIPAHVRIVLGPLGPTR